MKIAAARPEGRPGGVFLEGRMCEAKAYLRDNGSERQIMEDVVLIQPDLENDAYLLVGLLGEQKLVQGQIERIDFLKHKIYLRRRQGKTAGRE